jgi:hypothetical protein
MIDALMPFALLWNRKGAWYHRFMGVSNAIPMAFLICAAACWGLGTVLSKVALEHIPPLTLLVTQLSASLRRSLRASAATMRQRTSSARSLKLPVDV